MLYGISDSVSAMSASSLKASVSVPPNQRTLRAMVLCLCCLLAARVLGLLISASAGKSGDQPRTTGPAVPVLADAIGACRTRLRGGGGGFRARAAAPERAGATH